MRGAAPVLLNLEIGRETGDLLVAAGGGVSVPGWSRSGVRHVLTKSRLTENTKSPPNMLRPKRLMMASVSAGEQALPAAASFTPRDAVHRMTVQRVVLAKLGRLGRVEEVTMCA